MGLSQKISGWMEQLQFLMFRAPIDTITTRFMLLFLVMLSIPLFTVIFFSVSLLQDHLNNAARNQILVSTHLLENKLQSHHAYLALHSEQVLAGPSDPVQTACTGITTDRFCLLADPLTHTIHNQSAPLSLETLNEQSPGLMEKVLSTSQPLNLFSIWKGQLYLMSAQSAENKRLLEGQPLNDNLLAEIFRENPTLPTEIWVLQEPVDFKNPIWLARAGNTLNIKAVQEILQKMPSSNLSDPQEFKTGHGLFMGAQTLVHGPDNKKLARILHILPMDPHTSLMSRYYSGIYLIAVISLLFSILVAFGAGRSITQPLLKLIQQVNTLNRNQSSQGQITVRGSVYEINQLAESFNRMLQRLEQEHRMKDEFVATLTHDLKVPMLAEKQTLAYFSRGTYGPLTPEQTEIIEAMRSANASNLTLVNGLLQAYRHASGEFSLMREAVNLSSVSEEALNEIQALLQEKNLELTLEDTLREKSVTVYADPLELKRVLHNLISNAITNTPRRGRIRVYIADSQSYGSEKVYKVSGLEHTTLKYPLSLNGRVLVSIQDSGIGFSAEDLSQLFRQFAAGQGRHPMSIGLGLYNCNKAIEAHDGNLWIETTEGEGSTVNFLLPQTQNVASDRRRIAGDRRHYSG